MNREIKGMAFGLNRCESAADQRKFEVDLEKRFLTNKYELLIRLKRIDQKTGINQVLEEMEAEIQNARN